MPKRFSTAVQLLSGTCLYLNSQLSPCPADIVFRAGEAYAGEKRSLSGRMKGADGGALAYLGVSAPDEDGGAREDAFCKAHLPGTMTGETRPAICPEGAANCSVLQTYRASLNDELGQDLDCAACDASISWHDLGLMYSS